MTSVLIVEDDAHFASVLSRDLERQGYQVHLRQDVSHALELIDRQLIDQQPIDVVLTDLRLDGLGGIALLAELRSRDSQTRSILMSGFATARDYQNAIELGAVRVLSKPFTGAELTDAIKQALDCKSGFRGNVHGLSLVDVLQMFNYSQRSLLVAVDGVSMGQIYLENGQIVHAEHGPYVGIDALRVLLAMEGGALHTGVLPVEYPRTIDAEFQGLLLDTLRSLDEQSVGRARNSVFDFAPGTFGAATGHISEPPTDEWRDLRLSSAPVQRAAEGPVQSERRTSIPSPFQRPSFSFVTAGDPSPLALLTSRARESLGVLGRDAIVFATQVSSDVEPPVDEEARTLGAWAREVTAALGRSEQARRFTHEYAYAGMTLLLHADLETDRVLVLGAPTANRVAAHWFRSSANAAIRSLFAEAR